MKSDTTAIGHGASPAPRRRSGSYSAHLARAALVACAILVPVAGGCGAGNLRPIRSEAEFNEVVLKADRPVVVEFYKAGCVSCLFIDPCMDKLADEYIDRVDFVKFELQTFWGQITCDAIWKRHRIGLFPTVLLFVDGREKKRWAVTYSADAYREVLDPVVAAPTSRKTPAANRKSSGS